MYRKIALEWAMDKAALLLLAVLCFWVGKSSGAERVAGQSDWEKTVQAAKQEGKIFIYAALGPYHADIFTEFQKDYPEIKASILHGNSSRISPRSEERRVGKACMCGVGPEVGER